MEFSVFFNMAVLLWINRHYLAHHTAKVAVEPWFGATSWGAITEVVGLVTILRGVAAALRRVQTLAEKDGSADGAHLTFVRIAREIPRLVQLVRLVTSPANTVLIAMRAHGPTMSVSRMLQPPRRQQQ